MYRLIRQQLRRISALALVLVTATAAWANVTVSFSRIPLREAMREIEKVSDLRFFYKSNLPGIDTKVSLTVKNATPERLLETLLTPVALNYSLESNGVVVVYKGEKTSDLAELAEQAKASTGFSISGTVTDQSNEPVIGATVKVRNTRNAVVSDYDGHYNLSDVHPGDVVEVTFIGYEPGTVTVAGAGNYDVKLTDDVSALNEVVVVGYGSQKKVNLTGAVSVIKSDEITGRPSANAAGAIQGADPSLNLTFGSGGPNAGYSVDIRGVASINGGSPLILVDGVQMDLSRVNANDIESVSILKDASAAAIYGAKASSGVVLVTTKSGQSDSAPRISFDLKAGWKTQTVDNDYVTSGFWGAWINDWFMYEHNGYGFTTYDEYDYAELWMRLGQTTEDPERPWSVVQPDKSYKYYANFDWYNHYFKKNRPMQDYNVSITGGSNRVSYYVSGRMYTEDGMIRQNNDKFKSFSTRAKMDIKITDWLKYGVNTSFFNSDYHYPGGNDIQYIFKGSCLHSMPYIPSLNPDGTSVFYNQYNYNGSLAVGNGLNAVLNYGKHFNKERNREFVIKNDIELRLMKDWTVNADYSYLYRNYEFDSRRVPVPYSQYAGTISWMDPAQQNLARDQYSRRVTSRTTQIYNIYTTWAPHFGEHNLKIMAGMNGEIYHNNSLKAERYDLLSTELSSFNLATGDIPTLIEDLQNSTTRGYFGRINYDYAGKYLLEVSGRYDGSSRFAKNHRWGFFPSASAGWRIGQEKFWEPLRTWWNDAKIRASIGTLGNQQVGYYDYIETIDTSLKNTGVTLDGQTYLSYATDSDPVAGDLTWEKVTTYDLGLDLSFFNTRLNFTGDMYIRDTRDMLTDGASLPATYGAKEPRSNCADLRTRGWELAVTWNDRLTLLDSPFRYSVSAGVGDYKSKITKFDNPTKLLTDYYVGMTLGELWGYHIDGLFPSDEAAAAYDVDQTSVNSDIMVAGPSKGLHGGDLIYADLDGDKVISIGENTADNPGDRRIIGNTRPRYNYNFRLGLEWKGIDISAFFQGIGRRNWYPNVEATTFWGPYSRPYQAFIPSGFLEEVWTPDNPDAYFPRWRGYEALGATNQLGPANDRYMQNLAYLRLKNLTVGYTLPVFKKIFSELRVYFSGENLLYWSPFKKHCRTIDPETAATISTGNNYGFAKSFTFGINVVI